MMAGSLAQPRASRSPQNIQLSYEIPQRIHTAKTYPLQSKNGSTIILYGVENGVKIVWRGGRSFRKSEEASKPSSKTNGSSKDVVMLDDSDDDAAAVDTFVDNPEFDEDEQEQHPSRPYPEITQVLDLYLGTDVLDIAVLPASIMKAEGTSWRGLDGLKKRILFVVACADNKVRVVNLPLTPPSPASKARPSFRSDPVSANAGNGSWGETVTELIGHQKTPNGVSITVEFDDAKPSAVPRLIIASHSSEVTGLLLLFRVELSKNAIVEPFQTMSLSSPTNSISFNPSLSKPRSSQLLVVDPCGACRVYDFKRLVKPLLDDLSSESSLAEQGTWLLSLYPGFQLSKNEGQPQQIAAHAGFGRKTILDAKWVSGGKAILALLGDGQWVIWDIEGVGKGSSSGLLGRQGLAGGSRSEFAISSFIDGVSKARVSGAPQILGSKFAPMTPGTRKSTEPFGGRFSSGPTRGQISVSDIPSTSPTSPAEESVVLWFGDSFAVIPNLSKYWAANSRKASNGANLFNGTPGGRMIKLEAIDLQGERCVGIDQLLKPHGANGFPTDILILAEHRYIVLEATVHAQIPAFQTTSRLVLAEKKNLNVGDLDVTGIENMLMLMDK